MGRPLPPAPHQPIGSVSSGAVSIQSPSVTIRRSCCLLKKLVLDLLFFSSSHYSHSPSFEDFPTIPSLDVPFLLTVRLCS